MAGLLIGIELCDSRTRSAEDLAEAVLYRCLELGISFKVGQGNVLVLAPPLNIDEGDLFWALGAIANVVTTEANES